MKKVVLRAPLLTKSGYGVHARQVFQYLLSKPGIQLYTQCVPWGITPWYTNTNDCDGLVGEIIRRSAPQEQDAKYDVSLQVILPNEWDPSAADFNIGITAGVETDICNPTWASLHCNKMDMVIVPSEHAKATLQRTATSTTPIHVVPEAYFPHLDMEPKDELNLGLKADFNFLTVGVMTGVNPDTDRKNLFYLIKWFVEEFHGEENVGLVIKTNRGRETTIDRKITAQVLERLLSELNHKGSPKIHLLHGSMTRDEMNALYKHPNIKCLVSATRGEGFGLPLLEAAAAGLPVIATNWSAHTEFLNAGKWIKVDYDLVPVADSRIDNNIFMKGAKWAHADEGSFKKCVRKFHRGSQIPEEWAAELSSTLKEKYSIKSVLKKYDEVLSGVVV